MDSDGKRVSCNAKILVKRLKTVQNRNVDITGDVLLVLKLQRSKWSNHQTLTKSDGTKTKEFRRNRINVC